MRRLILLLGGVLVVLLGLTGCSLSLESVPMPSQVTGPSYEVKAEFRNALNLPQGAPVKLRGNRVGTVQEIKAHDYVAAGDAAAAQGHPDPAGHPRGGPHDRADG